MYKTPILISALCLSMLAGTAHAGRVASDPDTWWPNPLSLPGGPGNSAAPHNGGDTSCWGSLTSQTDFSHGIKPLEGLDMPTMIGVYFTAGGIWMPAKGIDCSDYFKPF